MARGPISAIKDAVARRRRGRARVATQEFANRLFVNPLCSDYENVFAQVQPLINDMAVVRPFGVGANGGRLPRARTPELNLLDAPNDEMGWMEFARAMFATWLTEDELDIHVHMTHGRPFGYSILTPDSRSYAQNEQPIWTIATDDGIATITRNEVMQLRFSRSPQNIRLGVSPATAIRAYAQTEDVLAQYEKAYIENGAVPASITFIRASSQEKFQAVQAELENNLSGPNNKGKTIYVWRQFNNDTGEEKDQIEVKTIQGNNSTLAIKELSEIINDHLNKAYGVSNFILGDDSSAKYDNAELSDYQFTKRRVYPALVAFWDQFQFELERVIGGLGYAIQFELELPDLTERQKTRAEIAEKNVRNLTGLLNAGAMPLDAVAALKLPEDWKNVARGIYRGVLSRSVEETQTSGKTISSSREPHTNSLNQKAPCGSCDHLNRKALLDRTTTDALPEMTPTERKIYDELVSLALRIMKQEGANIDEVIEKVIDLLNGEAEDGAGASAQALELLADKEVAEAIKTDVAEGIVLSEALKGRISERTDELIRRYGEDAEEAFREALANAKGLSANEIRTKLREVIPTWQAERIARNETVYAFKAGRLAEDEHLAQKYNLDIELTWRTSNDPAVCPVCRAMDGKQTTLGEAFPDRVTKGDEVLSWAQDSWNDEGRVPNAHVNCRCYFNERIVKHGE